MNYPGSGCGGKIELTCDKSGKDETPKYNRVENGCTYILTWNTKHACPVTSGLSGGSILLIIFFVSLFLYIAIGMFYKHKKYAATGTELVPNIDFWREVPGYVKDGFSYTFSKCKK